MLVLDMDGVLVNFCKAAYKAHNMPFSDKVPTEFDFFKGWGMSASEFWKPIDDLGLDFWANLETFYWTNTLIDLAEEWPTGFMVATACSLSHLSSGGKVISIKKLFGDKFRDYALMPRKWFLSQPGYVLLDDHETNCDEWEKRGGKAILFPQPWNRNRYLADQFRMEWTLEQLTETMLETDDAVL